MLLAEARKNFCFMVLRYTNNRGEVVRHGLPEFGSPF
jgi:hypothetical protein